MDLACRPCRGSRSPVPWRVCFGGIPGEGIVNSPPPPVVDRFFAILIYIAGCLFHYCTVTLLIQWVCGCVGLRAVYSRETSIEERLNFAVSQSTMRRSRDQAILNSTGSGIPAPEK